MTPVELSRTVLSAVRRAVDDGELSVAVPARAVVTEPGPGGCGDYATNIALQLARPAGRPPLQVAEILRPRLSRSEGVAGVEITGPGFLNISLDQRASDRAAALVREIRAGGYGHGDALARDVVRLRIPYEIRAEVVADVLVRILATQGARGEIQHIEHIEHIEHSEHSGHSQRGGIATATDAHHSGSTGTGLTPQVVTLRPTPAPEDPTPLGPDAARWALLHPAAHDRPRVTADHLLQRAANPLFRVRYAHARARALTRNAAQLGFSAVPGSVGATDAPADGLLRALAAHPPALRAAATHRAPDRLARQLVTVADALLAFQHTVLPMGEEKPSAVHRARLALAEAAGTVLADGLSLLGISAPDHL
ncbi:ArgS-related anticodon-binding protein NrtL [Streptomyces sp. NPDC059786]|uniref:ArgS-related anticodon-binding protein NrtL n=1 Tax=Streptomyces sp. NPDC059786 TaxID=3346946 RepID=UPI00366558D0